MWKSRSGPLARKPMRSHPISEQSTCPWRSWAAVTCDLLWVRSGRGVFSLSCRPCPMSGARLVLEKNKNFRAKRCRFMQFWNARVPLKFASGSISPRQHSARSPLRSVGPLSECRGRTRGAGGIGHVVETLKGEMVCSLKRNESANVIKNYRTHAFPNFWRRIAVESKSVVKAESLNRPSYMICKNESDRLISVLAKKHCRPFYGF
jgi:hypothetical protein